MIKESLLFLNAFHHTKKLFLNKNSLQFHSFKTDATLVINPHNF